MDRDEYERLCALDALHADVLTTLDDDEIVAIATMCEIPTKKRTTALITAALRLDQHPDDLHAALARAGALP